MNLKLKSILFAFTSLLLYAVIFNWKVSVVLMIAVAWHEYSHILGARYLGLRDNGFEFIPLFGAIASIEKPSSYKDQVITVLAGPILGCLLALVPATVYLLTHSQFAAATTLCIISINLFNLLPLAMLDGGRFLESITYSISYRLGLICKVISYIVAIIVLSFISPFVGIIVAFFAGLEAYNLWKLQKHNLLYIEDMKRMETNDIYKWSGIYLIATGVMVVAFSYIASSWHISLVDMIK